MTATGPTLTSAQQNHPAAVPDALLSGVLLDAWAAIGTPLVVVDDTFELVFANPAARTAVPRLETDGGAALREFVPGTRSSCGTPLTPDRRPIVRALAGETVTSEELVVPSPDGSSYRRFLVSAHPLPPRRGRRHVLLSWSDITGRWALDYERRSAVERLTRLLDGAQEHAILMLDHRGHVLTWSRSAERLKRYAEEDVVGRPFAVFFTAEDRAAGVPDAILAAAAADGRAVTEGVRVRGDGSRFWARGVLTAVRDDAGRLEGFVKVTQDVSDEHEASERVVELNARLEAANAELERVNRDLVHANAGLEEGIARRTDALQRRTAELAEANQELEAFSYSVSHDLRAPVRAVAGFAELLAEEHAGGLDDDGRRYLEHIRDGARDMGELIEGLLRLARLARYPLRRDPVEMTLLVREAWAEAGAGDDVRLVLDELPPACGDGRLLRQVWCNLLSNAVKFSAKGPASRVEVTGRTADGRAVYEVRDNGVGFDDGGGEALFQPFRRLHSARDFPGTGLGLAIVQRIVQRHGGTVDARSVPGRGAVFTMTLEAP